MTDYLNSRLILEAYARMNENNLKSDGRFRVVDEFDVCEDVAKRIASNVVEMFENGKFKRDEKAAEKTGYNFQWFDFENETYKASVSFQSEDDRELPEDIDGLLDLVGGLDPDRVCENSHFGMCFYVGTNRAGRDAPIIVKSTKGMYPHGGYRKNCKSDGKVFSVFVDFRVVVKEDTDFDMLGEPFGKCLAVPDESGFGDVKSDFDDAEDDSVIDRHYP